MSMMHGYTKCRASVPYKCGICKHEIPGGYAMFTRLSDSVGMCFQCYIKECRKNRNDRDKCHCRKCSFNGQPMCEHALLSKENAALKKRVKELESKIVSISKPRRKTNKRYLLKGDD